MSSRRKFIKKIAAVGATVPFISNIKAKNNNKGPIIICSRGNEWGEKVLKPGWDILSNNGDLLDAIEKSANITELDPSDTSVGYGGLPNEDGVVQLDASIMYGPTHNCGSVGALEGIKTPCSVARLVMERTDHIHIMGKGAQDFARAHGFKIENLLTEKSRKIWLRWKENISDKDDWFPPKNNDYDKKRTTGTINVLAVDSNNDVAGMVSAQLFSRSSHMFQSQRSTSDFPGWRI